MTAPLETVESIPTPRTDAMLALVQEHAGDMDVRKMVPAEHARDLERELSLLKHGLPDYREVEAAAYRRAAEVCMESAIAVTGRLERFTLMKAHDAILALSPSTAQEGDRDGERLRERSEALEMAEVDRNSVNYLWLRNNTYVVAYWIDGTGGVDTKIRAEGSGEFLDASVRAAIIREPRG